MQWFYINSNNLLCLKIEKVLFWQWHGILHASGFNSLDVSVRQIQVTKTTEQLADCSLLVKAYRGFELGILNPTIWTA